MCIACLELSTQPCQHRWYRLHNRCSSDLHLGNCPNKLQLHGWESRKAHCPFCEDWPQKEEEYRLLGQTYGGGRLFPSVRLNDKSVSASTNSSNSTSTSPSPSTRSHAPSLSRHLSETRQNSNQNIISSDRNGRNRRGSGSVDDVVFLKGQGFDEGKDSHRSSTALQDDMFRSSSDDTYSSLTHATGTKNRAMNRRLNSYFKTPVSAQHGDYETARSSSFGNGETPAADDNNAANITNTGGGTPSSIHARDIIGSTTAAQADTSTLHMPTSLSATQIPKSKFLALSASETRSDDTRKETLVKGTQKKKGTSTNLSKKLGFLFLN